MPEWERRFVADPERAREMVEVYRNAGFEVRVVPLEEDELEDECEACALVKAGLFRVLYTRRTTQ